VDDAFGQSIALSGDTVAIGAPHDDDKGNDSGSVYVFTRSGTTWSQQTKLTAADGAEGDVFGISIAISDDTIVIGADLNDEKALNAGAVYVFTRSGSSWSQQAKLTAADGAETDIFGVRVALSGDTVLISARRDDDDVMGIDAGSAYIFTRTGTTWQQQAKLTASDGAADDRFGRSVALDADTAVIGAMFQDDKGDNSGSAYMFTRSGNSWQQQVKLTASDGAEGDVFGWSVALSADIAVIAAGKNFRFRVTVNATAFLDDTDKRFVVIGGTIQFPDIFFVEILVQENMAGCQYAAYHFYRGRRKMYVGGTEFLLNLTEMTVPGWLVRANCTAAFRVVTTLADGIAPLARASLDLDHRRFDHAGLVQGI